MAVRLGILHVERDILRGLTAKEFRAWEMYYEVDPFDELRADYRIASVVQMLYNVNRGTKQKALPLKDFLLTFGEQGAVESKPKQTQQQQWAMLQVLAAMHANEGPGLPQAPEGPRSAEEQKALEESIEAQLAAARKASH